MSTQAVAPRVGLGQWPTPLHLAERLSEALGLEVWLKRDDLSGLGLGGNKTRPLEFLLAAALQDGHDVLLTGAGPQSNWAFLAALAARRSGLEPVLCFYGDRPAHAVGNLRLLDQWVSPEIHWTGSPQRLSVDRMLEEVGADLVARGRRPMLLPRGGATPLATAGYLTAAEEIDRQLPGSAAATAWLATGSCGTQAGLVLGASAGHLGRVVGVTVSRPAAEASERVIELATAAAALWGLPAPVPDAVIVLDGWIGPGYGAASEDGTDAAMLVARTEGILLDPVFGAKAMAALVAAARAGTVDGPVIFLVSGGAPTLFAVGGGL